MAEQMKAGPVQDRPGHDEPADRQAASSLAVYGGTATHCTVCGRPDGNLSIPFGRCLPCIKAASEAYEAKNAVARQRSAQTAKSSRPYFLDELRPQRSLSPFTAPAHGDPRRRFEGLLRTLNSAPQGKRNATLHWVACRVGEMLAAGELPDGRGATDALARVALGTGLTPREVPGTIRSGFSDSGVYV